MDLQGMLEIAVRASLHSGREIMKIYSAEDIEVELKKDNTPLTIADKKAHETIVDYLAETAIPVLSEEGKHLPYEQRVEWKLLWIVDPLDGTKEFIKRNGEFTVNIALVQNGKPILGVVYAPYVQDLYFAGNGIGAYKYEGVPISYQFENFKLLKSQSMQLPLPKGERPLTIVASRSHLNKETKAYIDQASKNTNSEFISKGSSLKICMVAEGRADIYPRYAPTMEWDTAAGHAIAVISGAIVTQTDEKTPVIYNKENLLNPWFIIKRD